MIKVVDTVNADFKIGRVAMEAPSEHGGLTPYAADPKPVGVVHTVLPRGIAEATFTEVAPYALGG